MLRDPKREEDWGFSNAEVKAMQRLRGSRLLHFYGVGDCVLSEPDQDGGGDGPQTLPAIRETCKNEVRGVWDFVVVELMAGGSLADLLRRKTRGAWPWRERLALLCDVAEGMAQMHAKRYIHRDLKPDNVLLDGEGRAKIADLGLARTDAAFDVQTIWGRWKLLTPREPVSWDKGIKGMVVAHLLFGTLDLGGNPPNICLRCGISHGTVQHASPARLCHKQHGAHYTHVLHPAWDCNPTQAKQ